MTRLPKIEHMQTPARIFTHFLFINFVVCLIVVAGSFGSTMSSAYGQVHSSLKEHGRRPLTEEEKLRLRKGRATSRNLEELSVRDSISHQQRQELRDQGWDEETILFMFAEHGITRREVESLKRAGFDFQNESKVAGSQSPFSWPKDDLLAWISVAADAIVIGRIERIHLNKEGPYHTEVLVGVEQSLKHFVNADKILVKLLYSGLYKGYEGKEVSETIRARANFEPQFKEGERVLLFLQTTPRMLQAKYLQAQARGQLQNDNFIRSFGTPEKIQQTLQDKSYYEVQSAYKVVGNKAVLKSEGFYVSDKHRDLDMAQIKKIAQEVSAAQIRAGRKPVPLRLGRLVSK